MTDFLNRETILKMLREHCEAIAAFGVARIGLFGSFQKDQQTNESDIDLIVEFEQGKKTFSNFIELSLFLEGLFKRNVELLTRESLSPYIGPRIIKETEYVSTRN